MRRAKVLLISVLASFATLTSFSVNAEETTEETTIHDKCELVADMAKAVMGFRQMGFSMTKMLKEVEQGTFHEEFEPTDPEFFDKVIRRMINAAYSEYPLIPHRSNKAALNDMFVSEWSVMCYNSPK